MAPDKTTPKKRRSFWLWPGVCAGIVAALGGAGLIIDRFAMQTVDSSPLWNALFVLLFIQMLMLPLIVLLAIAACAIPRVRRVAAQVSVALLQCLVVGLACMRTQEAVRLHVCPPLLQQAGPLITAIEAHEDAHGRPPDHLDELVPDFLDAVPAAPFGDRRYRYLRHHEVRDDRPDDRKWALWVAPPGHFMDWSTFRYEPRRAGPDAKGGESDEASWFTRFGDWIYFRD